MKKYTANKEGWFCGHWNDSPLQIKYSSKHQLKLQEAHKHSFAEYYLLLNGKLIIKVNKEEIELNKQELIMIEPEELHKIIKKSKDSEYIIIKEKSFPKNKE